MHLYNLTDCFKCPGVSNSITSFKMAVQPVDFAQVMPTSPLLIVAKLKFTTTYLHDLNYNYTISLANIKSNFK